MDSPTAGTRPLLLGTFPRLAEGSDEYEGLPYQDDRQVLAKSAQLALELTDGEDHAAFWQPVLALGAAAHAWVADFIRDFLLLALETPTPRAHFADRWKSMIEFAESSPAWQAGVENLGSGRSCGWTLLVSILC